ncbi:MAG: hypothetical protein FWG83_03265 [Oscillospiraceae bacterium]|nr:hypothetical protein [Oscillospiraceae bacterium]
MTTMIIIMVLATIGIILGFVFGVKRSYKIRPVKFAHDYLDRDSIKYRQKSDTYIRTYVTKVKIQTNSGNSGGKRR